MAYNVNDVAIKSYDVKRDDYVIKSYDDDGQLECAEPPPSLLDPYIVDRIKANKIFRPQIVANDS